MNDLSFVTIRRLASLVIARWMSDLTATNLTRLIRRSWHLDDLPHSWQRDEWDEWSHCHEPDTIDSSFVTIRRLASLVQLDGWDERNEWSHCHEPNMNDSSFVTIRRLASLVIARWMSDLTATNLTRMIRRSWQLDELSHSWQRDEWNEWSNCHEPDTNDSSFVTIRRVVSFVTERWMKWVI